MFGKIVILATLLAVSIAELPVNGPYAPSGWRPQGKPFILPNEYAAPQQESGVEIEITKQRVDYAGQLDDNNAGQVAPNSAYLPPSSNTPVEVDNPSSVDILRVQGLPAQFKVVRVSQLNTQEYVPQRQFARIRRPLKFLGNIRIQQISRQRLQQVKAPATQYGAPIKAPATQYGAPVKAPATQYGAPIKVPDVQYGAPAVQPATQYGAPDAQPAGYPDPRTPEGSGDDEEVADGTLTKGEYFILTPEKTLQKVTYMTSQNKEEARTNGFTAQLKYTPVDQVDGPLYKYNEQGQLVRINKK